MTDRKPNSGRGVVIGILVLGVFLALVGLKFRRFPEDDGKSLTPAGPATTRIAPGAARS
jgi:hypothetical protein